MPESNMDGSVVPAVGLTLADFDESTEDSRDLDTESALKVGRHAHDGDLPRTRCLTTGLSSSPELSLAVPNCRERDVGDVDNARKVGLCALVVIIVMPWLRQPAPHV